MRHLMIDGKYLDAILSGKKTLTIRLNKPKLSPGDLAYIHSKGKIRGIIRVKRVYRKKFEELTEEEALKDGFSSLEELKKALEEHYGNLQGRTLRVIEFELVKRLELDEYTPDPVEIARKALERLKLSPLERRVAEAVLETGSIRKAAEKLYGDKLKRRVIRRVLRRLEKKLEKEGNLGEDIETEENGKRKPPQKPLKDFLTEGR